MHVWLESHGGEAPGRTAHSSVPPGVIAMWRARAAAAHDDHQCSNLARAPAHTHTKCPHTTPLPSSPGSHNPHQPQAPAPSPPASAGAAGGGVGTGVVVVVVVVVVVGAANKVVALVVIVVAVVAVVLGLTVSRVCMCAE